MAILYAKSLFIFRRDLRLHDNTALIQACQLSGQVIPCFILDPRQISEQNDYKSDKALQFMLESLLDLERQLLSQGGTLSIFKGEAERVVADLLKQHSIDAMFFNADYTPFSLNRDGAITHLCEQYQIAVHIHDDVLLNPPFAVRKADGHHYSVFTPYWKAAQTHPIASAQSLRTHALAAKKLPKTVVLADFIEDQSFSDIATEGGRSSGLRILKKVGEFQDYKNTHDIPTLPTTLLSAHLKFGTLSIRETYHSMVSKLGAEHSLIRQLYWRDFYTQIAFHAPFVFGHPYQKKFEALKWSQNKKAFAAWCEGKTGFPIVDAGMRQLNSTGWMHNRVRMIVASFLTKDLHIHWLWGERYFAQKLIDYDPAVNNGNWQWSASTGCDPQPYFRIFNPWLQQKKFDPNAAYIKRWVIELKELPAKLIHQWYLPENQVITSYPRPIVEHSAESKKAKEEYKRC